MLREDKEKEEGPKEKKKKKEKKKEIVRIVKLLVDTRLDDS